MKIIPIFFPNAGCKYRCAFCNEWMATMKCPPNFIEKEIEDACKIYHPDENSEVGLYGGTFTGMENWHEILERVHETVARLGLRGIRISTRPDEIKDVDFLVKNGVVHVEIGAQSMVQSVLDASKRNHTVEDVIKAVKILKDANLKVSIHLMTGLPKGSKKDDIFSAFEVAKLHPDGVRIHPTLVLKNTELERMFFEGKYVPQTFEEAIDVVSDMITIFKNDKIQLGRIGMYQDELTLENVIAGPYHPAFGEIALSVMYKKFIEFSGAKKIYAPKNLRSQIIGRNKVDIPFEEYDEIYAVNDGKIYFEDWLSFHVSKLKELIG